MLWPEAHFTPCSVWRIGGLTPHISLLARMVIVCRERIAHLQQAETMAECVEGKLPWVRSFSFLFSIQAYRRKWLLAFDLLDTPLVCLLVYLM